MGKVEISTIDKEFYRELGKKITDIRHKRGYSIRYVAELTGLSRATVDHYELGKSKIKPETFKKICQVLNIKPKIEIDIQIGVDI